VRYLFHKILIISEMRSFILALGYFIVSYVLPFLAILIL